MSDTENEYPQFLRDVPKLPDYLSRKDFIKVLYYICTNSIEKFLDVFEKHNNDYFNQCNIDAMNIDGREFCFYTFINAIKIADEFIDDTETPVYQYSKYNNIYKFLDDPCKKIYSFELAFVCLSLSSCVFEDNPYNISDAIEFFQNSYLYKLHWEICIINKFHIKNHKFIEFLGTWFYNYIKNINYALDFNQKILMRECKFIAINKCLFHSHPIIILCSIIFYKCYLQKKQKSKINNIKANV